MLKTSKLALLAVLLPQPAFAEPVAGNGSQAAVAIEASGLVSIEANAKEPATRPNDPRLQDRTRARRALLTALFAMAAHCEGGCPTLALQGR